MTQINIKISNAVATSEKDGILTAGMVGVPVSFSFDSGWDGLSVTAVFSGSGKTVSVPLLGATQTVVPWEVLTQPNTRLRIGAEGRLPDGTLVIPTTWATVGNVMPGANATDDLDTPPTPTAFDRIMSLIGNLNDLTTEDKSSLVAAINEAMTKGGGTVDEAEIQRIVEDYLATNPPTVTETDPTVPSWAKQPEKPSYTADEVGALSAETLPDAITTALSQAKASGAFDGADGITPHIGENGNWYLGHTDTGKPSRGEPGAGGKSAYQYAKDGGYTGTETEFAAKLAAEMPTTLPNPNALTFTGAVTGSYDGSALLTVNIPSGGSGGGGWELVSDTTLSEDVSQLEYTDLDCYDLRVAIFGRWNNADDSLSNANINANILMNETGIGYQYSNGQIGYIRPSGGNFHTLIEATAANALYPKIVVSLLPNGSAVSLKAQGSTFESMSHGSSWSGGKTEKLNRILIVPATSGAMLKAGARIIAMKRS